MPKLFEKRIMTAKAAVQPMAAMTTRVMRKTLSPRLRPRFLRAPE